MQARQSIISKMASHYSTNTCGVEHRCVIKFLVKEKVKPAEIFRRLSVQLGDACPPRQDVYRWCDKFIKGQESVVEDERRRWSSGAVTVTRKTDFKVESGEDYPTTKSNPESKATPVKKSTVLPGSVRNYSAVDNNTTKSTIHQIKHAVPKTEICLRKSSCVTTPASKGQFNSLKLLDPIAKSKMDNTKNPFTNLSIHQSLKSNPMLQGLSGNSSFHCSADKAKETPTCCKGVGSTTSSSKITPDNKTKPSCCSGTTTTTTTTTPNLLTNDMNTKQSTFFKTAHSTMCIPQQSSSVIISSPFKHLMVGPKISNQPSPFHGPVNNNSTSSTPDQQTPGNPKNANEGTNCKILFHSGKGGTPAGEQAGAENTNKCKMNSGSASAPEHRSSKANLATMDPERLALIKQRKRDRKFRKLQSLSALMRAPDDRHSMGPLTALTREFVPNKILGLSPKYSSLSSNPFHRPSLGGNNQMNKLSGNNPWKGENTKNPCSFIHEPSLKNSAILSQTSSVELPKRKFDYQKNLNSPNSCFGTPNVWKTMTSPEPVKEIRPTLSASSVIDDALRIAALKFIKNEIKDKESSTAKDATPISAEIFGSNKIKTPNFFLSPPKDDGYQESTSPSPGGEANIEEESPNNKAGNVWSDKDNKSSNLSSKSVARTANKSRKRKPSLKRKRQMSDANSERNRSVVRDLKRPVENSSDENETSSKETDKIYPESKRSKVSDGANEKGSKRRGRPPLPSKMKALKSVKRRGRPPLIGAALKAKLQKRAAKSRKTYGKGKLVSAQVKSPKRRGRPRKNPNSPTVLKPKNKAEIPKLTDEELLKVKLKIPRRRGRPSKAEAMLREMAVAHLAASDKANTDAGDVNIGLGLTIRPRPARKQSSASRHNRNHQPEDEEQPCESKKIKSEPVSSEESMSGDVTTTANNSDKVVKVESNRRMSQSDLGHASSSSSSSFDAGQRKRKPFKKYLKSDPDYVTKRKKSQFSSAEEKGSESVGDETNENTAEEENGEAPANRSRPLLLRNVKKNSKPIPTFTDSEESETEESADVEYKTLPPPPPKPRMPVTKVKSPIKVCRPMNTPHTGQMMPPIYNVPRVLLPPSIKDTGIPCKMCGKVHTQDHFFKYMELKSTDQPHRCPLCGQYFSWSCLFIEHMRSHPENTAQYRCEYCYAVSRKISAYFNCRITHSPPSAEWLELQKTCDEYLASLNEAKEKKNPRYNRMVTNKFVKPIVGGNTTAVPQNFVNMNATKDKNGRFPKITPNKVIKTEVNSTATTTATETKNYNIVNLNGAKDKKTSRCAAKMTPNKVVKAEVSNTTPAEIKDVQDKLPMTVGKTKSRASGRKEPKSKKPYKCKVCRKTFLTFDFLTKHKQLHKSKRPYTCKKCGKRFATRSYFTVHKRTYHSDNEKSFVCEVCGLIFPYLLSYTTHINRLGHLSDEEHRKHSLQPHVCDICQRGFKIKQSLINHVRTHTGERPFICEVCNKGFTQTGSLDRHRRIHQRDTTPSEKPSPQRQQDKRYRCKPCKKTFSDELAYQNHIQNHTEDKFYCDFCEQTFPTAQLLKNHKHNEQRPFKCRNCGRCYKLKQSLTEHKRVCS